MFLKSIGGTHSIPAKVREAIFELWYHNKLIHLNQVVLEIGMGVPRFALSLAGYFKHVVATDVDLNLYTSVVSCFEQFSQENPNHEKLKIKATHNNGFYQQPSTERSAKRKKASSDSSSTSTRKQ